MVQSRVVAERMFVIHRLLSPIIQLKQLNELQLNNFTYSKESKDCQSLENEARTEARTIQADDNKIHT